MKKPIYKRKRFWGIIVLILFFLSLTISNYLRFGDNTYVGEITQMTETSITLKDGNPGEETLQISDITHIVNKQENTNSVSIGDRVMIIYSQTDDAKIAEHIRVLRQKSEEVNKEG